ncbi:MAG: hypothetical protein JWM75_1395 [Sphingomonas bacterium]|jgi:pilus assembly protein CpaD|nr:hypothetical protein [Sphingomonas bacterium]
MRPITTAALLAIALSTAACGPVNRGLSSVNQPVVSQTNYVFDARGGMSGLAGGEAERLSSWFDSLSLGYGDRISVDDPTGSPATRDAVAQVAARYGLLLSNAAPITTGSIEPGALRVVVSRSVAEVPNCPNWERKSQPDFAASTMSNYGCATNSNLAAMIADPLDLIEGRDGASGRDTRVAIKAIQTYRDAQPTGMQAATLGSSSTSTKGGN